MKSLTCKCHPIGDSSANSGIAEGGIVVHIEEEIKQRDFVRIVYGNFLNPFAVVTDKMVGDKFVIQHFQKKEKRWVLHPNDYNAREAKDLKLVSTIFIEFLFFHQMIALQNL